MTRDPFGPLLARDGVVVIDGGLSTQLETQGCDLADALWSARLLVEDPDQLVAAHLAYYRAGARVATTASYQATFEGFAKRGISREEGERLLRLSVACADRARTLWLAEAPESAARGPLLVAASVGPYGAMLADGSEYRGRYGLSSAQLADFHRDRLQVLAASGADLLACETLPELEEAQALVALLDEMPDAAAWLSFSCADGAHIRSGVPVEEAFAVAAASDRVVAVGVNCTAPEHVDELLTRARSVTAKPLLVYPNGGDGWDATARRWIEREGPAVDGAAARRWVAEGAAIVGGCCRVGTIRIAEIAEALAS